MKEKVKVPELRFPGFTDDWEERKLGSLSENTFGGGTPKTNVLEYWSGTFPWIQSSDLDNNKLFNVSPKKYITENAVKNSATKIVPSSSIAIVTRVGVGKLAFMSYEYATSQDFLSLSNLNTDGNFSIYAIYKLLQKELNNIQGTSIKGITKTDLLEKSIVIPSVLKEQQKIGSFFKQLDETIDLHQRKLDLLKEQKKGYLQKMFPKNGAKVPELRFAGFADDWEERKLGDHAKYRRGSFPQPYGNKEWYDGEGAMPFVQVVDVTNKLTLVENTKQKISKLAQSKSVFVPKGKVVVTLQGSIGRVAITQYDSFVDRTLLIFEDYEKETDERFWAYTIQKKFEIEKLKAPGGTIKTITKEALSSFDVHLPKFEEQQKIGSFFKQLDETIALHQRKLDLLKEQKKGFLQKMFV